jgi:serine/threonine protein phosphatase PrpC
MKPTAEFKSILTGAYSVNTSLGYSIVSHSGIRYKHLNQDYMLATSFPISPKEKLWLFGVFDGHGKAGEYASKIAADSLSIFFS